MSLNPKKWLRDYRNTREIARRRAAQQTNTAQAIAEFKQQMMTVSDEAVFAALADRTGVRDSNMPKPKFSLKPYTPPFDGIAPNAHVIAMDANFGSIYGTSTTGATASALFSGGGFPGFAYLTELTQINEYRDISESTAKEMTRKWIKLRSAGEEDRDKQIDIIEKKMRELHVKEWFTWAATMDGFMGRAQIFVDFGDKDDAEELKTPLLIQKEKIAKGSLKRLKGIEPITTYPASYNADDPLAQDYYIPSSWFVYAKEVHTTRLLQFVSRPVPDLLKPVYNFSGMSLSQLALPYVDYWLSTRDSVGRLLKNFSTTVFKTNMSGVLQGQNYENFKKRVLLYTAMQNNQGVFMCDKETEEFQKVETSLSGLDKLQAQAQEHMASVAKTPLTVLFGLSPVGLTATAETDITIFNNHVNQLQEAIFRRPLEALIKIIMCSELGEIYDDITFDFVDLVSMDEKSKSAIRTANGTTDQIYIQMGVVSPKEVRAKLANDPESGYDSLDVDAPEGKLIDPNAAGAPPTGGKPGESGAPEEPEEGAEGEAANEAGAVATKNPALTKAADMMLDEAQRCAMDAGMWLGNQHTESLKSDNPTITAMRCSAIAQKATNVANRTGSRALHKKAVAAHSRALNAHREALLPATSLQKIVHQSYIDAHTTALAAHEMEAA